MARRSQPGKAVVTLTAIAAICTALAGGGAYYWQRFARADSGNQMRPSVFVRPEVRSVDATVTATGTIRLRTGAEVRVGAQISGIVTKLNVTVGSHIQKDEVIAVIDSRGLNARIAQARAQIEMDQTALHKLEFQLDRAKRLRDLIPRQQEEDLAEDVTNARAKLDKSRSDLAVVESDTPYLTIRAPISGTIASVSTQQGETVAASFNSPTFVTIIEDNALELVAMVDETDIANVRRSNAVVFTTETYPSREFHGTVERISPKATIVSGVVNYEVGVALRGETALLRPDMTANATIQTAHRRALTLPNQAIHQEGELRFVFVMRNGAPEKREIAVGPRAGGWTEIKKGARLDEQILVAEPPGGKK
jgi:RND family efflux transporter MFP subunit